MKSTFLTLIAILLLFPITGLTQITLQYSDYPTSPFGADSLKITTYNSTFPPLPAMPNGIWDISTITDSLPVFFTYRVPPVDTAYQFADSSSTYFALGYAYNGNINSVVTDSGVFEYGISVEDTAYSLTLLTGGFSDSLYFPYQQIGFSSQRVKIPLPANYGQVWASSYQYDVDFSISYSFYGYLRSPCFVRRYISAIDSIVGWGRMRVKDVSGSPSIYFDVLQVQSMTVTRDSFFLGGAPMPGALLSTFTLTQGKSDTTYEECYYRKGELTPLAKVLFEDRSFSAPLAVVTHVQRLIDNGVQPMANVRQIVLFPNPSNGIVHLSLPVTDGDFVCGVIDILGNRVLKTLLHFENGQTQLTISPATISGSYWIQVTGNGNFNITLPLQIEK